MEKELLAQQAENARLKLQAELELKRAQEQMELERQTVFPFGQLSLRATVCVGSHEEMKSDGVCGLDFFVVHNDLVLV